MPRIQDLDAMQRALDSAKPAPKAGSDAATARLAAAMEALQRASDAERAKRMARRTARNA